MFLLSRACWFSISIAAATVGVCRRGWWNTGLGLACGLLLGACAQAPTPAPTQTPAAALGRTRTPAEEAAYWRYADQVREVATREWHKHRPLGAGTLRVKFLLKDGKVQEVQILDASQSFPELTAWTLYCLRHTKFPPMPEALKRNHPESTRGMAWVPFTAIVEYPIGPRKE